jgi:hypothetical protein
MTFRAFSRSLGIGLAVGLTFAGSASTSNSQTTGSSPASAPDPYGPLALYNGKWDVATPSDKGTQPTHLVNHCERTGIFFVCEQVVNGKSEALVVFLPVGVTGDTLQYRTQGLSAHADRPGEWGWLAITGERWVYSSREVKKGATVYWRTVNVFTGSDRIHFEQQRSTDGRAWTTLQEGDERRVP